MLLRSDFPTAATIRQVGQVDPVPRADGVADPRQDAFQRSLSGMLGKALVAQVLARMGDGSFLVKVEGTPVRMLLPKGAQVGTDVPLTLLSTHPRATFQVAGGDGRALPAAPYIPGAPLTSLDESAAAYDAKGAALPGPAQHNPADAARAQPPQVGAGALGKAAVLAPAGAVQDGAALLEADGAAPAPVLSETARVISSVLAAAQQAPGAKTAALTGTEPLLATPKPDPAQLAHKLAQTISQSGLFYESHLAEWATGTRSLAELMHEPQSAKPPGLAPTEPATAQFINLQLASQEQARVLWQGQLAPGQQLQWEIHKDAPEQRGGEHDQAEPAWRSGMRFRLPLLGEIDATVVMVGKQCQIEIQTGSGAIGEVLRAHAAALTAAMEAAGTPLSSLTIGAPPVEDGDA